jgi:hypothetical protein
LKFSDIVIAVATMAVVVAFICTPLDLAFVSALGLESGYPIAFIVYLLVSALIVGYVFAGKIQEARKEAIAKITVVWGAFWMVLATIVPAQAEWGAYVREAYQGQYGSTLSTYGWVNWESVYTEMFASITVIMAVVTSIIGLYIGSKLRKPKKT